MRSWFAICLALVLTWRPAALAEDRPPLPAGCEYLFSEAEALDLRQLEASSCDPEDTLDIRSLELTVTAAAGEVRALGPLGAYLDRLHGAGESCQLDGYERGAVVICRKSGPDATAPIVLDLEFQPTRYPELAHVAEIRVGEIRVEEPQHLEFLESMQRGR